MNTEHDATCSQMGRGYSHLPAHSGWDCVDSCHGSKVLNMITTQNHFCLVSGVLGGCHPQMCPQESISIEGAAFGPSRFLEGVQLGDTSWVPILPTYGGREDASHRFWEPLPQSGCYTICIPRSRAGR